MKKNRPCLNGLVLSAPVVGSHGPPSLSGPACQLCVRVETSGTPKPRVSKDSSLKRRITIGRPYRGAIKGPGETGSTAGFRSGRSGGDGQWGAYGVVGRLRAGLAFAGLD